MRDVGLVACFVLLLTVMPGAAEPIPDYEHYWPQWRGPLATGAALYGNPPLEWSETKNIKWKTAIPGKGSASPIIWAEKIFVVTAVPTGEKVESAQDDVSPPAPENSGRRGRGSPSRGLVADQIQEFKILILHRNDGRTIWERVLRRELPHEGTHPTGTWASGSPVTDGKHVIVSFGSRGLYCLDMNGELIWEKDLGDMQTRSGFGEGSSPTLYENRLVVNWDHEGQSFIVALDKQTGEELWRRNRDEITSWATPLVVEHNGIRQVIVNATKRIRSYNLEDGSLIWECEGMTQNVIPSPVTTDGMVYVTSGFRGNALLAIRLAGSRDDISGSEQVVWQHDRHTPYVPSPLLFDGSLYFLSRNSAIISSFDSDTGKPFFGPERLKSAGDIYASPVGAADRIYIPDRDGTTVVLEHGPEMKVLAVNSLDDGFDASPAIVADEIYLRGKQYLYRISEE